MRFIRKHRTKRKRGNHTMNKLSRKDQIFIGITLFSMFFGAGNLIFPPFLGLQAGSSVLPAFAGFAVSAIGLPVLGVAAVARSHGLPVLAGRVSRYFAAVFTMLIYLSIGPCLAIPRTASTSFEMAVTPFAGTVLPWMRAAYSVVFFAAALILALRPLKLVDRLGKRLAPVLLALIAVLFLGCLFTGGAAPGQPAPSYVAAPAVQGFLDGYQTMDAMAALIFGIVLAANIRVRGIKEDDGVVSVTIRAGFIAGLLFATVYGALTYIGVSRGKPDMTNGAELLSQTASHLFGTLGMVIVGAIFVIACLNTCIGLICCCAEYFNQLFPRMSYAAWAVFFAVISTVIANAGLNAILKFSVPILTALYPMAIMLIALAFLPASLQGRRLLYPLAVGAAGIFSILAALDASGIVLPCLTDVTRKMPLTPSGWDGFYPAFWDSSRAS
jgi:LIVCS family branched-chain amino acid:cation transporter